MIKLVEKLKVYTTLIIILSVAGMITATVSKFIGLSQYSCNFIHGVIIAVYSMENWALLDELQYTKENDVTIDDAKKTAILKELTSTNSKLVKQIEILRCELEKYKAQEKKNKKLQKFPSIQW